MSNAESTLGDITTALQSIRTLVVNAGDAVQTPADRQTIATQIAGLRDQVLTLANSKDSNGMPLFAGLGSALTPFAGPNSTAPDYSFKGLSGQATSTTTAIPSTIDGNAAFMDQPATNGVYNVAVTNATSGTGATPGPIPTGRTLTTSGITVTNSTLVTGSAYSMAVTGVDSTTVPGTTTVTYNVTESPNVGGPYNGLTASYPTPAVNSSTTTQTPATFTVTAMPGLSMDVTGTPAVGDTLSVTPSSSLFTTLDKAVTDIGGAANQNAANQAVAQALNNIDLGLAQVSAARGQAGTLLNRATVIASANDARTIQEQTDQSNAQDINMVQAISAFQNQQTGYSAALQSYAQIQKLSLFNYING
jgi:flagellar hook-associated protein 3 FlgL